MDDIVSPNRIREHPKHILKKLPPIFENSLQNKNDLASEIVWVKQVTKVASEVWIFVFPAGFLG